MLATTRIAIAISVWRRLIWVNHKNFWIIPPKLAFRVQVLDRSVAQIVNSWRSMYLLGNTARHKLRPAKPGRVVVRQRQERGEYKEILIPFYPTRNGICRRFTGFVYHSGSGSAEERIMGDFAVGKSLDNWKIWNVSEKKFFFHIPFGYTLIWKVGM